MKFCKVEIYGCSHDERIGVKIHGLPSGICLDMEQIDRFLARRKPVDANSTPRRESDSFIIASGMTNGVTDGGMLEAYTLNKNTRSGDYESIKYTPRPGHADYAAYLKDGESYDNTGGGRFSGRMTAPLCFAGAIFKQLLGDMGICVSAKIDMIAGIYDIDDGVIEDEHFAVYSRECGERMCEAIAAARMERDSVGGIISCRADGVPCGIGDCYFGGLEGKIAPYIFAVPAVKGIEFGSGFRSASMRGSENNDGYYSNGENIYTKTNNCGGILGGISTGGTISFRAAIKPTPSIGKQQDSVDLRTLEEKKITVGGRHDPCIVPRGVVCIEAAACIAIYNAIAQEGEK